MQLDVHENILRKEGCALVVIDLQEKFRKSIPAFDSVVSSSVKLIKIERTV